MRTLRAALASTRPPCSTLASVRIGRFACSATRNGCTPSAETAVQLQPFWLYAVGRFACTPPAETAVGFRRYSTPVKADHPSATQRKHLMPLFSGDGVTLADL